MLPAQLSKLLDLAQDMRDALADLDRSMEIGDVDMAGDHALTLEEIAHEFQQKATR